MKKRILSFALVVSIMVSLFVQIPVSAYYSIDCCGFLENGCSYCSDYEMYYNPESEEYEYYYTYTYLPENSAYLLCHVHYAIVDDEVVIMMAEMEPPPNEYAASFSLMLPDEIYGYPVTTIGENALLVGYPELWELRLPSTLTTIGNYAVSGASLEWNDPYSLIPDSVTNIGEGAFSGCYALEGVVIPANVTSIGAGPFFGCAELESIAVDANNQNYCSFNGDLYTKDKTSLVQYSTGKKNLTFEVPESVINIGDYAFRESEYISRIIIPKSTTYIGKAAFKDCNNLTDVYFGGSRKDWTAIEIEEGNECLKNATIHFAEVDLEYITGDANDDGEINVKDVISIRRFITGSYGTEIHNEAADANKDGEVNVKDVITIRRYISGGYGVEL